MQEILNVEGISFSGCNERLKPGKTRFYLNPKYRSFKEAIYLLTRPVDIEHLVRMEIEITCHPLRDIDSVIKPILDGVSKKCGFNDRHVAELYIRKFFDSKKTKLVIIIGEVK
jgi:Holliday junction resolvase RusA-like endonuclease